jgi:hypothetical protein
MLHQHLVEAAAQVEAAIVLLLLLLFQSTQSIVFEQSLKQKRKNQKMWHLLSILKVTIFT